MIRNIKALCLAFAAVCAMSAVVAGGAQAGFTASSYPASGEGGQTTEHVFTVQGQTVKCQTAVFTGSLAAASSEITITPKYENCTAFGFLNATVHMNTCDFLFTTTGSSTGEVHVLCTKKGDSITITGGTCTVHIPEQTPTTNKIDYKNESGGVLVTSTAEGIHASVTRGFGCPLTEASTDTSGKYTGSSLFKGLEGVTVSVS